MNNLNSVRSYVTTTLGALPNWLIPNDPILDRMDTFDNICAMLTRFPHGVERPEVFQCLLTGSTEYSRSREGDKVHSVFSRFLPDAAERIINVIKESSGVNDVRIYELMRYTMIGVATTPEREEKLESALRAEKYEGNTTMIKFGVSSDDYIKFLTAFNEMFL